MGVRILQESEARALLQRHPEITADVIPTYGLRIVDGGRDYLIGLVQQTGEIKVIDLTYIDPETGQRVSMAEAEWKAFLFALWKYQDFGSWYISGELSERKVPEILIAIALIAGGLWLAVNVKRLLK